MSQHRQFSGYRFLLVFFAILIIVIAVIGLAILATQNSPSTNETTGHLYTTATATPTFLPTIRSVTPTQISSITPTSSPQWGPLPPLPAGNRGLITNGDRAEYKIALTFDVCQSEGDVAGYDTEIIRILNETQAPATFFLGGLWMRDHPAQTQELASNPLFELGNHSWSHPDFTTLTPDEKKQQILLTQQTMFDLLGYQTNLFRLPYGTYDDDTLNVIGENGLYIIQWDDVSGDPDPNIDAQSMIPWVLQQVQPGSIIIMHANGRGWHTAEALPAIIQSIREQGYNLVTISDLLGIQPYK